MIVASDKVIKLWTKSGREYACAFERAGCARCPRRGIAGRCKHVCANANISPTVIGWAKHPLIPRLRVASLYFTRA